jgi:NADH:ubiquinone oxidoreductase subunit 5 (subunit L)/multisubunit Na+/H+ antiporter MnhA subunit
MYIALLINPIICLFHIIIHALFKSLLFILSGSIIHNSINYQSQYKIKINQLFIKMLFISSSFILILSLTKEIIIYSSIINYYCIHFITN